MAKNHADYYGQTLTMFDAFGDILEVFEIASNFRYFNFGNAQQFLICFAGWKGIEDFEAEIIKPVDSFKREFDFRGANVTALKEANAEFFAALETSALTVGGWNSNDYRITTCEIDVVNLTANLEVEHKRYNGGAFRRVVTPLDFYELKIANLEFIGMMIEFAWTIGKQKDVKFLGKMNPVEISLGVQTPSPITQ